MLRVAYGKFKPGRIFDFVNYFKNEEKLAKFKESLPNGVEFINAYIVDRGQADHHFELVYQFDSYVALDEWGVSEKSLRFMEGFIRDLGLYTDSFKEKFIKTVDEFKLIDEGVFKEVLAKEKERAK